MSSVVAYQRAHYSELVGITEIAEAFGVVPNSVHRWRKKDPTFPCPFVVLRCGSVFHAGEIVRWALTHEHPLVSPLRRIDRSRERHLSQIPHALP